MKYKYHKYKDHMTYKLLQALSSLTYEAIEDSALFVHLSQ